MYTTPSFTKKNYSSPILSFAALVGLVFFWCIPQTWPSHQNSAAGTDRDDETHRPEQTHSYTTGENPQAYGRVMFDCVIHVYMRVRVFCAVPRRYVPACDCMRAYTHKYVHYIREYMLHMHICICSFIKDDYKHECIDHVSTWSLRACVYSHKKTYTNA